MPSMNPRHDKEGHQKGRFRALHEAVEQSITVECCAQNMDETSLLNMVMN
jgi:hypothetical protein